MAPINPRPIIKIPKTALEEPGVPASLNSGISSGGGGVKVGKRVSVGWMLKAAARVGSMVEVTGGVGVGGGSTIRSSPPEIDTNDEYTQPVPPVGEYEIWIHSRPGEIPSAGTTSPGFNCPMIG